MLELKDQWDWDLSVWGGSSDLELVDMVDLETLSTMINPVRSRWVLRASMLLVNLLLVLEMLVWRLEQEWLEESSLVST